MKGFQFSKFVGKGDNKSPFERLLDVFLELMLHTSGEVDEALSWMNNLDRQYNLTNEDYSMGDFIEDLKKEGYLEEDGEAQTLSPSGKTNRSIRRRSLEEIFGKLKRGGRGNHQTGISGRGDENLEGVRSYRFGDGLDQVLLSESIKNGQRRQGGSSIELSEEDLVVREEAYKTQVSTVLMIDISHSMILYGEDRITPAKKTAMALAELIMNKYPKDTLDIIVFGNDAWQIQVKDLPYLKVGPYHTNTVAGLELAMDLLRKRKNNNKQIFMITDGKPTCLKEFGRYYKNSWGLDRKIINKTLTLAAQCRRIKIPITTFMIAKDPYLQEFVQEFTKVNNGRAFFSSLQGLGEFIFADYQKGKKKKFK